jgi:hypothetical protein
MKFRISSDDQLKIIVRRTGMTRNTLLLSIEDNCYTSISEIVSVIKSRLKYVGTGKISVQIINITKQQIKDISIVL